MENTKLIGANSYTFDNYDVTVLPRSDKILDLYLRDNFKMEIYEAKSFVLNKINVKAVEDALRKNKKDITCYFNENNCDGQQLLELIVTIQMPLIPKIVQTIFLAKTKTLKNQEIVNVKLLDIKKAIIKNQQILNDVTHAFGGKIIQHFGSVEYATSIKQTMATLIIPKPGKYLITISAFLRGNAATYATVELNKGDICPGSYYGLQAESSHTPIPYIVKTIIDTNEQNFALALSGSNGSSYTWGMSNLIMSAQAISV